MIDVTYNQTRRTDDSNKFSAVSGCKQILSRILKYTVDEFRNMDFEDIIGCIGDDIEIGTRPVDAGLSNLGRVKGTLTEDNIPGEGMIFYDIRFTAYYSKNEMKI